MVWNDVLCLVQNYRDVSNKLFIFATTFLQCKVAITDKFNCGWAAAAFIINELKSYNKDIFHIVLNFAHVREITLQYILRILYQIDIYLYLILSRNIYIWQVMGYIYTYIDVTFAILQKSQFKPLVKSSYNVTNEHCPCWMCYNYWFMYLCLFIGRRVFSVPFQVIQE